MHFVAVAKQPGRVREAGTSARSKSGSKALGTVELALPQLRSLPPALSRCLCQLLSPGSLGGRVMVTCGGRWREGGRGALGRP